MPWTREAIVKLLADHKVDAFITSTFGSTIGTLVDRGLTDDEIFAVFDHLLTVIRATVNDPEATERTKAFVKGLPV